MPDRLNRFCVVANCPRFSVLGSSYCQLHRNQQSGERRESASRRGYDRRHQLWRKIVIARHPICTGCGERLSAVGDHIRDLDTFAPSDPAAWNLENGTGLCVSCHGQKSGRKGIRAMKELLG